MIVIQNPFNNSNIDQNINVQSLTLSAQKMLEYLHKDAFEVVIRMVDKDEIQQLNAHYRQQNKPTNVLSFASDFPAEFALEMGEFKTLGDVVICTEIVVQQAMEQGKSFENHLTHLVLHGVLHLLGYDHERTDEALEMERLEIKILQTLGVKNPYF